MLLDTNQKNKIIYHNTHTGNLFGKTRAANLLEAIWGREESNISTPNSHSSIIARGFQQPEIWRGLSANLSG